MNQKLHSYKEYAIQEAKNEDILFIKNVVFTVLREYGLSPDEKGKDKDLNDIENNYFNKNGFFGVLTEDNEHVIGTFGIFQIDKDICELRKMYLLKDYRGKGLGKFMLANALNIAKEKKYKRIILETITPLKEAISLYKKFGFTEIMPKEKNSRVDQAFQLILTGNKHD